MKRQTRLVFTFENPNSIDEFRKGFAKIVVDRLLSQYNNSNNQLISKNEGDAVHPPNSKDSNQLVLYNKANLNEGI